MNEETQKKILVADDSQVIQETLKRTLQEFGFAVVTAQNGIEVIEKTFQESPDLIILDMMMSKMKGYQACRFLKQNPATAQIPIILCTVKTEKEDVFWGRDTGADEYLDKGALSDQGSNRKLLDTVLKLLEASPSEKIPLVFPSHAEILTLVNELWDRELRTSQLFSRRLTSLFAISNEFFMAVGRDKLCRLTMDVCLKLMDASSGSLMLLDPVENKLRIVSSFGLDEKVIAGTVIEMGERVSGWVAQNKKPVLLIDGLKKYPLFAHLSSRQDIGSSVSVPLLVDGKIKGVLNLNRSLPRPGFNNEDLEFVTTLANYLASAIEKDRLYNELVQSEKMGALGYFASGMAHEIRNPLATISAEAQYLIHKALIPESQESLRTIVSESERISDIIERLLSFCRPRERKLGPLEVLRAIDETLKLVSYQMNVANIQVTKDIPANLPEVIASLSELEEVFLNLILNAHQAMSSGGVLVISAFTRQKVVGIKFTDTGKGIPAENLKSIFEPFFTTKAKGLGLGLFISNQIIQSMGGWIEAESIIGKGTSFTVFLTGVHDDKKNFGH